MGRWADIIRLIIFLSPAAIAFPGCHSQRHNYYLSGDGNDQGSGDRQHPWKTIGRLNQASLQSGDTVFFESGETFTGILQLNPGISGTEAHPVIITSTSGAKAMINGGNGAAMTITGCSYLHILNLALKGSGRKTGNTANGILLNDVHDVTCENLDIMGFQKSGASVYMSRDIRLKGIYAHENGFAGISVSGAGKKTDCQHIEIVNCKAENNPGDPTELNNHSGNGIIAGYCSDVLIDHCTASNNGWDMPRIGNGPVGIWCFEANRVTIQYCIAYQNKTAPGAADGGGFDLDGGVTNSVIQHCLSYENQGSGYGVFQYAGASDWNNNTIRFCISKNDGNVSAAHAGVFIWNSSDDAGQLSKLLFANNIIDNDTGAAISYETQSMHSGFRFVDNIFMVRSNFIIGNNKTPDFFKDNRWIRKTE